MGTLHLNKSYSPTKPIYIADEVTPLIKSIDSQYRSEDKRRVKRRIEDDVLIEERLQPYKKKFKDGNVIIKKYNIVEVGYVDKSIRYPFGGIVYQLVKIED